MTGLVDLREILEQTNIPDEGVDQIIGNVRHMLAHAYEDGYRGGFQDARGREGWQPNVSFNRSITHGLIAHEHHIAFGEFEH